MDGRSSHVKRVRVAHTQIGQSRGAPEVLVACAWPASSPIGASEPRCRGYYHGPLVSRDETHKFARLADQGNPRVAASSNESVLVPPEQDLPRLVLLLAEGGERLRHLEQAFANPCIGDSVIRPYELQCLSFGHWIRFVHGLLFGHPPDLAR